MSGVGALVIVLNDLERRKTDGKKKTKRRHKASDDKRKEKWYHGTIPNGRLKPTGRSREPQAPAAAAGHVG